MDFNALDAENVDIHWTVIKDENEDVGFLMEEEQNGDSKSSEINEDHEQERDFLELLRQHYLEKDFQLLKSSGVNLRNLHLLTEKDIIDIFGSKIGQRAQFRALVNEFRLSKQKLGLNNFACEKSSIPLIVAQREKDHTATATELMANISEDASKIVTAKLTVQPFNLIEFLDSPIGEKIKNKYKAKNGFTNSERDFLVSNIVQHHLNRNLLMTLKDMERTVSQICEVFETEKDYQAFYFTRKPYVKGKIYVKYRSLWRAYQNSGMFRKKIRARKQPQLSNVNEESKPILETKEKSEKDLLPNENYDYLMQDYECLLSDQRTQTSEDLENKWKNTFPLRENDRMLISNYELLEKWPIFKHASGIRLIEIDFDLKFPNKISDFSTKFKQVENNLISVFEKNLKYAPARNILNELATNIDCRRLQYIKLLNALLKPVKRKLIDGVIWKVSTVEAWNSMIFTTNDINMIPKLIDERKKFCTLKAIPFTPFITQVLNKNIPLKYIITSDSFSYSLDCFLSAFDLYIKQFHVFNCKYPFENEKFLKFIQDYFYGIPSDTDFTEIKSILNFE